jgi:integrase
MPTLLMITLTKHLMEKRDNTEATAQETVGLLRRLAGAEFKSLRFLTDVDKVLAALSTTDSTRKKQLGKIVAALSLYESSKTYSTTIAKYRALFDGQTETVAKAVKERAGAKTDKEEEKWMDWPEVEARHKVLAENAAVVASKKTLTPAEWRVVQAHAILSLYVLLPPRRNKDYHQMYVVRKASDATDTAKNYFVLNEDKMYFNSYKTSKALGPQTADVPPELSAILRAYIKRTALYAETKGSMPDYPLICRQSGIHMKPVNTMTYLLSDALGKAAGSNMLRHSYLTHKYGGVTEEMADDAEAMAHSVGTQATYIRVPAVGGAGVDTVELV